MFARVKNSLVWRTSLFLIGSFWLVGLILMTVMVWQTEKKTSEILIKQHMYFTDMLWDNLGDEDDLQSHNIQHPLGSEGPFEFAIYDVTTHAVVNTSSNPPVGMQDSSAPPFQRLSINDQIWWVSYRQNDQIQLVVASPENQATSLSHELTERIALLMLFGLLIVVPALLWSLRHSLLPIKQFTSELSQRAPSNLSSINAQLPDELQPMQNRLNELLSQLDHVLARERRFTADAAHELRTPLAAIRLKLELAQSSQRPEVRQRSLQTATNAVDRATHTVSQLLALARLEHDQDLEMQSFDLVQLAHDALTEVGLSVDSRYLSVIGNGMRMGQPVLWSLVLRNLIDNAMRYSTSDGSAAEIYINITDTGMAFSDRGVGMSDEQKKRLGERFYRPDGQLATGAGLGWSIIDRVAQLHHVQITFFDAQPQGFGVKFTWPS